MLPPDWLPPNYHELKTEASKLTIDRIASRDVNTNIVFHQGFYLFTLTPLPVDYSVHSTEANQYFYSEFGLNYSPFLFRRVLGDELSDKLRDMNMKDLIPKSKNLAQLEENAVSLDVVYGAAMNERIRKNQILIMNLASKGPKLDDGLAPIMPYSVFVDGVGKIQMGTMAQYVSVEGAKIYTPKFSINSLLVSRK